MENRYRQTSSSNLSMFKNYNNIPTDTSGQMMTSTQKNATDQKKTSEQKKPIEVKINVDTFGIPELIAQEESEIVVSQERLQEAIIWSEILGKPVSRRRKRR